MTRVAKRPITLSKGVEIDLKADTITLKGPNGSLSLLLNKEIQVSQNESNLLVSTRSGSRFSRAMAGTTRALINNMATGVTNGFERKLELVGVGYRAAVKGTMLNLQLGYSHDINFEIPKDIKITIEKQTTIKVSGHDKQQVGVVTTKIKSFRAPEPYKGKGIRIKGEYVLRKEGKKK